MSRSLKHSRNDLEDLEDEARGIEQSKKQKLKDTLSAVPPYLFRIFDRNSGGGKVGLNSPEAIVPHAFLYGRAHDSIYHMKEEEVLKMVRGHLTGRSVMTEFSSWAASLMQCFYFLNSNDPSAYLAVLDTRQLPGLVTVFNTHELWQLGLSPYSIPLEFLAHGEIRKPALVAVLWSDLKKRGVDRLLGNVGAGHFLSPRAILSLRKEEVVAARKLAEQFGKGLTFFMTIVFLTTITRKIQRWRSGSFDGDELDLIIGCLADVAIPEILTRDTSKSLRKKYVDQFPELVQLLRLLPVLSTRALHKRWLESPWIVSILPRIGNYSKAVLDVIDALASLGCTPDKLPRIRDQLVWAAPVFFGENPWKSDRAARQLARDIRGNPLSELDTVLGDCVYKAVKKGRLSGEEIRKNYKKKADLESSVEKE